MLPTEDRTPVLQVSHYRLIGRIGAGAHGEVHEGEHVHDPRLRVAVKIITPSLAQDPTFVEALKAECRQLDRLDHPNVVRFRELVVVPGGVAMILELLRGLDLRERLARGPLPFDEAVAVLDAILAGLAHAHAQGVLHRDIKPANVFCAEDGRIKLLDFGIARAADGTQATQTGQVVGTLDYMAPERFSGGGGSFSSDVYAVGLVGWELLAGRAACPPGEFGRKVAWHLSEGIGGAAQVQTATGCPAWFAELVASMAARDPLQRPADAGVALARLRAAGGPYAPGAGAGLPPRRAPAAPTERVPEPTAPTPLRPFAWIGGITLAGVLAMLASGLMRGQGEPAPEAPSGATATAPEAPEIEEAPDVPAAPIPVPGQDWQSPSLGRMIWVPPGRFEWSEARDENGAVPIVRITRGFWLMERELTQRQQRELIGRTTAYFQSCGDSCPTEQLTWREAMDVAAVASDREGLRYRLPTMAEWSWARRGGSPAPLTVEEGASRGWYLTNSGGRTAIGCQLPTNALGICDIDGNVHEWTSDYAEPLVAAISAAITAGRELVDPQGVVPGTSLARVRCGSSFMMTPSPRVEEKDGRTSILDIVCSPVSAEQRWLAAGARFALYPTQEQAGGGG